MKPIRALIAAVLLSLQMSSPGAAQLKVLWRGTGGWGDKNAYCALFDAKTIQTLNGTVVSVDSVTPMPGMREGIELSLRTEKGLIPVHLGPRWYVENQDIDLKPQDVIEVTGSRVFCVNQDVIMASELRQKDKVFKFRDAKGRPLWVVTNP